MQLATLISVDYKYDNSISFFLLIPSSFHNIEPDKRHLASCRRYEPLNTRPRSPHLCPRKGEGNKMSAWDLPIPVNQSSGLVYTFPNELPDSILSLKEHGRCTYAHAVPA